MLSRTKKKEETPREITEEDKLDWRALHPRHNPFKVIEWHYLSLGYMIACIQWLIIIIWLLLTGHLIVK